MIANDDGQILNSKVVELFLRKGQNSRTLVDMGGLPKEWNAFSRNNYERLVRNLDV